MMHFGTGDLVFFEDCDGQKYLSVVLAHGTSGHSGITRVIYVIYSIACRSTWLAYESELFAIDEDRDKSYIIEL